MFSSVEVVAAQCTFALAVTVFVWKTLGVSWVPIIGPAMIAIFSGERPQYPRRAEDEDFWNFAYLCMYGILGSLAQWGGIVLSRANRSDFIKSQEIDNRYQEPAAMPFALRCWAAIYAVFHIIIGSHHLLWSTNKNHGKLELWRYNLPFIYELTGLAALGLCFHAYCILLEACNARMNLRDVCSRKTVMDCCTILTFVSFFAFLMANMIGVKTTYESERIWWICTMYPVPLALCVGTIYRK
ncbi:unnamed protein product [Cylindrotheca closterium]|uniref:Uncharacterized protein n=1 Tax=Cylindrotheca closterium TaxID=2856 RepID=A0AAD2G1L7_9STRA|nr:unnamed protein product [Cylindrotheca closterium]